MRANYEIKKELDTLRSSCEKEAGLTTSQQDSLLLLNTELLKDIRTLLAWTHAPDITKRVFRQEGEE